MARPFFTRERISDFEIYERNCDLSLGHAKNRLAEGHPIDFQVCNLFLQMRRAFISRHALHRTLYPASHWTPLPSSSSAPTSVPLPQGFHIHRFPRNITQRHSSVTRRTYSFKDLSRGRSGRHCDIALGASGLSARNSGWIKCPRCEKLWMNLRSP